MKRILAILLLAITLTGCGVEINVDAPYMGKALAVRREHPTVNLPKGLRQQNWTGDKKYLDEDGVWQREGSCVHASLVMLLRWQGRYATAQHWRRTYANGEWPESFAEKLDSEGIRYAETTDGDVEFLQWALSTCRGAGVTVMGGKHMVCLVHLDDEWAALLDNNEPDTITWVPRETFVAEWQNSNGWAVTPVYTPAPPLPDSDERKHRK